MATATTTVKNTAKTTAANTENAAEKLAEGLKADAARVRAQVKTHAARLRSQPATPLLFAVGATVEAVRTARAASTALPSRITSIPARVRDAVLVTSDNVADLFVAGDVRYGDLAGEGSTFVTSVRKQDSTQTAVKQAKLAALKVSGAAGNVERAAESTGDAVSSAAAKV